MGPYGLLFDPYGPIWVPKKAHRGSYRLLTNDFCIAGKTETGYYPFSTFALV
jgi:hypothetical protein